MAVLAIALDYSGRDDSGCGFCDAIAGAYFAYLAIATITGLLARSAVKALRSCGVASCYAWLPLPAGLILIAALPFAIIL